MDREKFKKRMDYMLKTGNDVLTLEEQSEIIKQSIEYLDNKKGKQNLRGYHNIVIVVEELSELTKELTKALRDKQDLNGIIEELADVLICIDYVKEVFDITDKELEYARSIKMNELKDKLTTLDNFS